LSITDGSEIGGSVFSCLMGMVTPGVAASAAAAAAIFASHLAINSLSVPRALMLTMFCPPGLFADVCDKSTTWVSLLTTRPTNRRPFCSNIPSL
jgi:hypothetical protein